MAKALLNRLKTGQIVAVSDADLRKELTTDFVIEEEEDPDAGDLAKGIGFEIAAGVATDLATKPLLAIPPVYALANFVSGSVANLIAQRLRGDTSINLGEVLSSGAVGIIPGTSLKAGKNLSKVVGKANTVKRAAISGGLSGVGAEAIRIGIDEQRLLDAREAFLGGAVGGTASASMKRLLDAGTVGLQNYAKTLKPIDVFAMSTPPGQPKSNIIPPATQLTSPYYDWSKFGYKKPARTLPTQVRKVLGTGLEDDVANSLWNQYNRASQYIAKKGNLRGFGEKFVNPATGKLYYVAQTRGKNPRLTLKSQQLSLIHI